MNNIYYRQTDTVRSVNEWAQRQDLEEGYTIANAKYLRDYSCFASEFRRYALLLYVLSVEMNEYYSRRMMRSAKKQAAYCGAVCMALLEKKVEKQHYKLFERDIDSLERRLEYIEIITKENIHLSEYEPFFNTFGDLFDFCGDEGELAEMARSWNAEHTEEVKKHMEEIRPELERHNEFIKRKKEEKKQKTIAMRKRIRDENDYVKEIKRNKKKNDSETRKIERSFERYYDGRV